MGGDFHTDPRSPERNLKFPEGSTPCPRAVAEAGVRREAPNGGRSGGLRARRAARGDFQNPRTGDGDLVKIHDHKPEFCTYFFLNPGDIKTFLYIPYYFVSLYGRVYFTKKIFRLTLK